MPRQATTTGDDFSWRIRLTRRAVAALAIASVLGLGLVHVSSPSDALRTVTLTVFLPVTVLLAAATLLPQARWLWQARAAIAALLLFGLSGAATVGLLGGPAVVLCIAQLLTALLLGRRATWITLGVVIAGVATVALAMTSGVLTAPDPHDVSFARPSVWLRSSGIALLVLSVIALTIAAVIESLEKALARERLEIEARAHAEAERAQAMRVAMEAQKLETVGRLAAGVAHDFNNALSVIGMCNQQLAQSGGRSPSDERALRGMIDGAVAQASSLARQLLLLARRQVATPTRIGLGSFLRELGATLPRILPADLQIVVDTSDDATVSVDPMQLQHAVLNLALNARDAMPRGGRLSLCTRKITLSAPREAVAGTIAPGTWITLEVQDDGVGMDATTRGRAFEALFTTKPEGAGTGLGLPSVLAALEMFGGHVTLWSEPGQGTRVTLWLPIAEGDVSQKAQRNEPEAPDLSGRTVLVVEDSASVLQLVREVLEHAGCRVLTAADGTEALALLERHDGPIDLLCSDVVMPGTPVQQTLERFAELYPSAPILILSGYVADDLARRGIAEGRYRQLPKPFSAPELLHTVDELTRPIAAS